HRRLGRGAVPGRQTRRRAPDLGQAARAARLGGGRPPAPRPTALRPRPRRRRAGGGAKGRGRRPQHRRPPPVAGADRRARAPARRRGLRMAPDPDAGARSARRGRRAPARGTDEAAGAARPAGARETGGGGPPPGRGRAPAPGRRGRRRVPGRGAATNGRRDGSDRHPAGDRGAWDGRWKEAAVDAELALARLLRQTGQLDEAATRLGELARLSPDRARDAELQIAELALGRYDLAGALSHAAAAEKGADAGQLARIAELRERAGDDQGAVATYRAAIARGGPPKAALALARLLERQGDAAGAASVLEDLLRAARDDAAISDAVRLALGVEESLGRLPALALALIPDTTDDRETAARRRALVEVLDRAL